MIGAVALLAAGAVGGALTGWRRRTLTDAGGGEGVGSVSVVVPARDEQDRLPRLLASLAEQDVAPHEVLVVDDDSTDATADVAAHAGATVVAGGPLPPGWAGKPWACHQGVAAAAGDRLVLLDADTWLAPDGLARLLAAHDALAPDGLLSVQPHHHVARPYEQLSLFANVVPILASGTWLPGPLRERSRRSGRAVAFGPCLVTTRGALDAAGGFAGVRGEVLEDAALAAAYRHADRPVAVLAGGDTVGFRMYPGGLGQLVEGWTKNLAGGAGRAPIGPTLGAAAWVAGLAALSVEAVRRPGVWVVPAWALASAQVWWLARRTGTWSAWSAVLFPVPLWTFVGLFARSAWQSQVRGQVRWRGRTIATRPAR